LWQIVLPRKNGTAFGRIESEFGTACMAFICPQLGTLYYYFAYIMRLDVHLLELITLEIDL
jgi:hypothetical protein